MTFKACLAEIPDCARCDSGIKETTEHTFVYYRRICVGAVTARIDSKFDVPNVIDNIDPPSAGMKRGGFLVILVVVRMVF